MSFWLLGYSYVQGAILPQWDTKRVIEDTKRGLDLPAYLHLHKCTHMCLYIHKDKHKYTTLKMVPNTFLTF